MKVREIRSPETAVLSGLANGMWHSDAPWQRWMTLARSLRRMTMPVESASLEVASH